MNALLSIFFLMLITVQIAQANPIDRLVFELSKDPRWQNGISEIIILPASTPTKELVAAHFKKNINYKGEIKDWKIYKEEKIQIPKGSKNNFTAVWCATEFGGRLILFQFESRKPSWWSKGFDAKYLFTQDQ